MLMLLAFLFKLDEKARFARDHAARGCLVPSHTSYIDPLQWSHTLGPVLKAPKARFIQTIRLLKKDFSVSRNRYRFLGLEKSVSRFLGLVSVSEKSFSRSLGLVSVSENHFADFSVSSRSRKFDEMSILVSSRSRDIDQVWYRSRLGLVKAGLV